MYKTPKDCEQAFYQAFSRQDLETMASVWDKADDIRCIHPRGVALMGRERVMNSWQRIFDGGERLHFALVDRGWLIQGDMAIHTLEEHIGIKDKGSQGKTVCTNIYRRDADSGWHIILHHASPLPNAKPKSEAEPENEPRTLH